MARTETKERPAQREQQNMREAPTNNLPATQQEKPKHPLVSFQEYAAARTEQLQFALPSHISPDRFTRVLMTALQRKPELLKCTRQSLWNACLLAAQDGLLPDGREGAIVPYGENEKGQKQAEIATWMPMIEGLRKKARNSGEILNWEVHVVRARDHFRFALGDDSFIEHEPYFGLEDPGEVIGAYSIATLKDGVKSRDVMSRRDLDKIRAKSRAQRGPWSDETFFPEMCKKTVARRHYKQLPHSSDLDDMIQRDDQAFGLEDRSEHQIEQRQARRITSVTDAFNTFAGDQGDFDHSAGDDKKDAITNDGVVDGSFNDIPDDPAPREPTKDETPKQASARSQRAAAAKETTAKSAPSSREPQPTANEPLADEEGNVPDGDLGDDDDVRGMDDPGIDHDANRLAPGQDPTNEDEYEYLVEQMIADATDARKLKEEFVNQGPLRRKCEVSPKAYDEIKAKVLNRIDVLKSGGK